MSKKLFWEESLPTHNADEYISTFKFYKSKDGTSIPIHISYKKSLNDDPNFLAGLNVCKGSVTYKAVADVFGHEYLDPGEAIKN